MKQKTIDLKRMTSSELDEQWQRAKQTAENCLALHTKVTADQIPGIVAAVGVALTRLDEIYQEQASRVQADHAIQPKPGLSA